MAEIPFTGERPPDDVLLDVREVAGFTIRPMSFGKMATMMPRMAALADSVKQQLPTTDQMTPQAIITFLMINMEQLIPIIAAYVDTTPEAISELPAKEGTQLAFAIWTMNARTFMDFIVLGNQIGPQ